VRPRTGLACGAGGGEVGDGLSEIVGVPAAEMAGLARRRACRENVLGTLDVPVGKFLRECGEVLVGVEGGR
jgi:hypothetical protein